MAKLKPGTRLRSPVCTTEVMVVSAPGRDVEVSCGGAPMIELSAPAPGAGALDPQAAGGTQIGKRYVNQAGDLELLCTKPGQGTLACEGVALALKTAKPLPASD